LLVSSLVARLGRRTLPGWCGLNPDQRGLQKMARRGQKKHDQSHSGFFPGPAGRPSGAGPLDQAPWTGPRPRPHRTSTRLLRLTPSAKKREEKKKGKTMECTGGGTKNGQTRGPLLVPAQGTWPVGVIVNMGQERVLRGTSSGRKYTTFPDHND